MFTLMDKKTGEKFVIDSDTEIIFTDEDGVSEIIEEDDRSGFKPNVEDILTVGLGW